MVGHPLPSREKQVPYLATQGCVLGKVLCSQNMSMDHILHKGEVHQVLPVSVGRETWFHWAGSTQLHTETLHMDPRLLPSLSI